MITIRAVSAADFNRPLSQDEYLEKMSAIQQRAASSDDMAVKTSSFWKMENLSNAFLKLARPGQSLNDARMPVPIRPISHCGMGIAAVELANFDYRRLTEIIESFSNPEYRLFAYEGSGAMLCLYEPDAFGAMSRVCGRLGILPLAQLRYPDPAEFLKPFDPVIRRLISYGYGRMLYFKNHNIAAAIRKARRASPLSFEISVQGIAFAYSMVNNSDLHWVFGAGESLRGTEAGKPFNEGLVYAIEFWEWMSPGFLDWFRTTTAWEDRLFAAARIGIDASRAAGVLETFKVEPSSTADFA
jgi:hypothetical protein